MLLVSPILLLAAMAVVHDIDDYGAISQDATATTTNAAAMAAALAAAGPGDTVLAKRGGVYFMQALAATNLVGVTIALEAQIFIDNNITNWPYESKHLVVRAARLVQCDHHGQRRRQG